MKRVRQSERKRAFNQPHKSRAKTLVTKALGEARGGEPEAAQAAVVDAVAALDKAVKAGALHRNAAARRKSRLMRKVNAALEGATIVSTARTGRTTGKAAAAKAAKARVAASKAAKAKGEQTAAGKARAALSRSTRGEAAAKVEATAPTPATTGRAGVSKAAPKAGAKAAAAKTTQTKPAAKATAAKPAAKPAAKATAAKPAAAKGATAKATAAKPAKPTEKR